MEQETKGFRTSSISMTFASLPRPEKVLVALLPLRALPAREGGADVPFLANRT